MGRDVRVAVQIKLDKICSVRAPRGTLTMAVDSGTFD
jgi:hypothetical protein